MQLSITADFAGVQRALNTLQKDVAERASVSAVNRTLAVAQTAMRRAIVREFNINAAKVRQKMFVRKARFSKGRFEVEAVLLSRDPSGRRRSINLINFGARETRQGLTVKVLRQGSRKLAARRGFIGNKGRTAFTRVGEKRLPIRPLQGIDVPQMFNTRRIKGAIVALIKQRFPDIAAREIAFYVSKFNGGGR